MGMGMCSLTTRERGTVGLGFRGVGLSGLAAGVVFWAWWRRGGVGMVGAGWCHYVVK